jgi:hypothetical protein
MECKFDHVHILSPDPEAVAVWFEKMLDGEIIRSEQAGKPRLDVRLGGQMIFILQVPAADAGVAPEHPHRGLDHFGVSVKNIEAVHEELKRRGAEFSQALHMPRPGIKLMFLKGPEGISVEVLERNAEFR